ncbi:MULTISPECIES: pyocin knob domain-containing protein [unclassified Microbacterium]|uniref:pyocin knob domain-containing protein n=1 Tax=unclassified Microbacterium TaxID=2609290 RepID=UPI0030199AE0
MTTVEYVWIANLRGAAGPQGPQGPEVPAEQLAAAVEAALAATGRLSDYGVAVGTGNPLTDLDALPNESGFYRAFSTALNRPPGFTGTVLHLAYLSTSAMQLGVPVGSTTPTGLWVRVKRDGVYGDWQKVPTLAEVTALLDDLDLVDETGLASALTPILDELAGLG